MKHLTIYLFSFLLILASCSKDEPNDNPVTGKLRLSGQVMSPNNTFPISKAKVRIYSNQQLISEASTDARGNFMISGLPAGELTVELSKGKFRKLISAGLKSDYELSPSERTINVFPTMAVIQGSFDHIENVLLNIGIVDEETGEPAFDVVDGNFAGRFSEGGYSHGHNNMQRTTAQLAPNVDFNFGEMLHDQALLNSYDIIFLNCGASAQYSHDEIAMANLKGYVQNGGMIYATDWMYEYIEEIFETEEYLIFKNDEMPPRVGESTSANVQILNSDFNSWLEGQGITVNPTAQINGFLNDWQMVLSFDDDVVTDWIIADEVVYNDQVLQNKPLAFTFMHGCGGVFFSSFHMHGNGGAEDTVGQIMNYFIFELAAMAIEDCPN